MLCFALIEKHLICVEILKIQSNSSLSHSPQSTNTITQTGISSTNGSTTSTAAIQKRLHVSNIPFRFRHDDLKAMFEVSKINGIKLIND